MADEELKSTITRTPCGSEEDAPATVVGSISVFPGRRRISDTRIYFVILSHLELSYNLSRA
jgi:hypothetical protein